METLLQNNIILYVIFSISLVIFDLHFKSKNESNQYNLKDFFILKLLIKYAYNVFRIYNLKMFFRFFILNDTKSIVKNSLRFKVIPISN